MTLMSLVCTLLGAFSELGGRMFLYAIITPHYYIVDSKRLLSFIYTHKPRYFPHTAKQA